MERIEKIAESWSVEMRKGYTKLVVLMFLERRLLTGYDIMKEIEEKTLGFWRLTAGGVYPILKELEGKGYIKGEWRSEGGRRKKVYEITNGGRRLLKTALQKQRQMAETMGGLFREFAQDILGIEPHPTLMYRIFDFFPPARAMEEKTIDEQVRILRHIRTRMLKAIKLIDERLEKLEEMK